MKHCLRPEDTEEMWKLIQYGTPDYISERKECISGKKQTVWNPNKTYILVIKKRNRNAKLNNGR